MGDGSAHDPARPAPRADWVNATITDRSRSCIAVEVLSRLRKGGSQVVRVEHVHSLLHLTR